jgi:NDP-sugar pyrophosphorylase family protein
MHQAFILGAGLGTRLRPLTDQLPKPLVPLFHRPLAAWAIDACQRAGIHRFAINTHHLPECWNGFGEPVTNPDLPGLTGGNGLPARHLTRNGAELCLFHEPQLLETGGGLKNIAGWLLDEPLLVHNGDIFSDMPLDRLLAAHLASGNPVTLALRSAGVAKHIALDPSLNRVIDIRERLSRAAGTHVFTGIYCINPEFLTMLPSQEKTSIIPAFLELARMNRLGAAVIDDGHWIDLGDHASYLEAHQSLHLGPAIHPLARIAAGCQIEHSVIGPDALVESGAVVRNSVLWPNSHIAAGADLDRCIVFSTKPASGTHRDADL